MSVCLECGKIVSQVTLAHLNTHGLTTTVYKEKYPGAVFIDEAGRKKRAETVKKIWAGRSEEERQLINEKISSNRGPISMEVELIRRKKISDFHKNRTEEQKNEYAEKVSAGAKVGMAKMSTEQIEERKRKVAEIWNNKTDEEKKSFCKAISDGWNDRSVAQRKMTKVLKSKATLRTWNGKTKKERKTIGRKIAKAWKDKTIEQKGAILRKVAKSACACPNFMESWLNTLLYPLGFKFVGDGSFPIEDSKGVMSVDFIRKEDNSIVELYGDRYHKKSEWPKRKRRLKKVGYRGAMVWASEVKLDPQAAVKKILMELDRCSV
jgi:hypothetical protein